MSLKGLLTNNCKEQPNDFLGDFEVICKNTYPKMTENKKKVPKCTLFN